MLSFICCVVVSRGLTSWLSLWSYRYSERFRERKERKVNLNNRGCVVSSPSSCKNLHSISSSRAPAATFVVPLCILNVDISAHISDDWGVFIQGDEVSGSSSPHSGRGCDYTDDTLLLRLPHMCTRVHVWTSFPLTPIVLRCLTWLCWSRGSFLILYTTESSTCARFCFYSWNLHQL